MRGARRSVLSALVLVLPQILAQDISAGCLAFLSDLDNDATIKSCTANMLAATADYNPVGNSNTASDASLGNIKKTLAQICSSSVDFCPSATIQAALGEFSGNCSAELAGSSAVPSVVALYDAVYVLSPLRGAMCSTDPSTSNSCMLEIAGGTAANSASTNGNATAANPTGANVVGNSTSNNLVQYSKAVFDIKEYAADALVPQFLYQAAASISNSARRMLKRAPANSTSIPNTASTRETVSNVVSTSTTFNATTFTNSNLLFLFLSPDMPTNQLCTDCTKQVFASYVAWESAFPYGSGLSNSALLGSQPAFWKAMGATCGSGFLTSINTIAGQTNIDSAAGINLPGKQLVAIFAAFATVFASF